MKRMIAPSVMCADPFALAESIRTFAETGIELLHVDVMDGSFVPNFTLGTDYIRALKAHTGILLDLHLMIDRPETRLSWFAFGEGDWVSVHAEATPHLHKAVAAVRERGAHAMVAVNPATPLCVLEEVLPELSGVLVMTVNPGFAGQKLVPSTLDKIRRLRTLLVACGNGSAAIEVDGNVSFENAKRMKEAGADIFVAGTSSVFAQGATLAENIAVLRDILK